MSIIYIFFSLFSYLIPTSKRVLVFSSFPDYTDNAYAMYKYISQRSVVSNKYKLVWLMVQKDTALVKLVKAENINVIVHYRFSLQGIWYFYRAKYVFCTHGLNSFIHLHQKNKIVNMWHGMPLKVIGAMDPKNNGTNLTKADYLVATSPFFQQLMSYSFDNINLEKIFLIGQPRNDLLFETTDFFLKNKIDISRYSNIGIWLPTYRSSIVGDIRMDGKYVEGNISYLSQKDLNKLDCFLVKHHVLLIVKLHPMDVLQKCEFKNYSNILILKQIDFKYQLYPLLGSTSFLLTDYSSVWVDYEILNKPIGFVMDDIEEYKKSRGLTIAELDKKLPGPILDTLDKLYSFLASPSDFLIDSGTFYNTYKDSNACQRLLKALNL